MGSGACFLEDATMEVGRFDAPVSAFSTRWRPRVTRWPLNGIAHRG